MEADELDSEQELNESGITRVRPDAARAPRRVFVVLTGSDELLEQVGQVLDEDGEVRHVENEADARQCVDSRHAVVMLVDARGQVDPGVVVERLHAADGSTVIVVFAPEASVAEVARAIRGSAAFAVLPIPIEADKTRAVLQGAAEEALARRALVTPVVEARPTRPARAAAPPGREPAEDLPAVVRRLSDARPVAADQSASASLLATGGKTPRARAVPHSLLVVGACLLIAGAATWFYLRNAGESMGAGPATERAAAPAVRGPAQLATASREELLDRARIAFHERRYSEPEGDNALHYYRSVLAQDPQDGEAREGLERIGAVLDGRLESALAEQRTADAERTLQQLRLIRPDDPALAAAEARLAEARTATELAAQRAQLARLESAQRVEQLERMVDARIGTGQLLEPANDSAKHYLEQLLALPNGRRLGASASAGLAEAFAARGRLAAEQGRGGDAERWFAEARALGHNLGRSVATPAAVTPAPVAAATPAAAQPAESRAADGGPAPATATAQRSDASAEAAAAPETSPVDFKRTRFVPPTYPQQALARRQDGEVRVRITVDVTGRVADATVVSASPPGVFDQAALNAVRKWRYQPIVKGGRPIEASTVTAILFKPEEAQR